jgi:HSP20 family molecular chaperone IbpA
MAVGSAVQIGFAGRGIIMNKFLLSVFSLALLACMTGVLAWQQPGRYHATYYSGQYDSGDSHLYRAEQPYGNRQGVNQPRGIRIEKASDADSYLLRIHTRGMSPEDITVSTERGRIRLETTTQAWRNWRDGQRNVRASTYRRFLRTLPLPRDANAAGLETRRTDDMLEIWIPRR